MGENVDLLCCYMKLPKWVNGACGSWGTKGTDCAHYQLIAFWIQIYPVFALLVDTGAESHNNFTFLMWNNTVSHGQYSAPEGKQQDIAEEIVWDLNTPPSTMDGLSRQTTTKQTNKQKINKETLEWNHLLEQKTYLENILSNNKCILLLHAHEIFSMLDHMMEHRNHSKFKKIEIISTNFFDHDGMKVEMNKRISTLCL